ncbi:MAG: RNA 2',3'-cyclic phosphodiesterase [Elusimicrobia bacterium]|nr:RNA 2',3'-cyclic phosphodiesterase [Elusimicrobiota bacterium]
MRSFLAIPLPDYIKKEVYESVTFSNDSGIKKTNLENLHITIAFLGDCVKKEQKEEFINLLKSFSFEPFVISLGKAGSFSRKGKPSILWIGLEKGEKELFFLREKITSLISGSGFVCDDKFHPHITLARINSERGLNSASDFLSKDFSGKISFNAEKFVWIESMLYSRGPIYRELFCGELK